MGAGKFRGTLASASVLLAALTGLPNTARAQEKAVSADAFVESIGVCTHWTYSDTPYGTAYETVKRRLIASGIRHVRDGLSNRVLELGRLGVKTLVVSDTDQGTPTEIRDKIKASNAIFPAIDGVEGPNEPDLFWASFKKSYKGQGVGQGQAGIIAGTIAFQKDLYTAFKSDPATKNLVVIGPALGKTYGYDTKSPLGKGTLANYVDYGNFHPYCFGGNSFSVPFPYDTIAKYYWNGNFPSVNLEEFPFAFDVYAPPYSPKPMAATETGYSTWREGASETAHAKYLPRLFCEYFRRGIARTFSYELLDEFDDKDKANMEANFGLLRHDVSPKPAYAALKSLIQVVQEKGVSARFAPGALDYKLAVSAVPGYDRTQYVHHLLLQKSDGDFYLLLWHEIANEDTSVKPHRQISPPALPATLTFKTPVKRAKIYAYDDAWNLAPREATLTEGALTLAVPDRVLIVQITPAR